MPLFNETPASIAQAVVTVKRALKAGVIEKADYKGLSDYLAQRVKDFGIDKKQLAQATKDLKIELELEAEEFFTEEGDALYKMAEELLEDFNDGNEKEAADEPWLDEVRTIVAEADAKQKVLKAWANMDDMERAAMAKLVNEWQK
jgi:DNA-binding transcriptional regulator GbsR (MarR family)